MVKIFLKNPHKFISELIVVVHLYLVNVDGVAFNVTRLRGGDQYTYVKDYGVVCNNDSEQTGVQCKCPNGETLMIQKEEKHCLNAQDLSSLYGNWYEDFYSASTGPRLLLQENANIVSIIQWEQAGKKWKTPHVILNLAGEPIEDPVCSSTPIVLEVACNLGSGTFGACQGFNPIFLGIRMVTSQLNNTKHFAVEIDRETTYDVFAGHLMVLKIKCGSTITSPVSGYLMIKFDGTKTYNLIAPVIAAKTTVEPKSNNQTTVIVGGVVGGIVFICVIAGIVCFVTHRRRRRRQSIHSRTIEKKEKEDLSTKVKDRGNDEQVGIDKFDLVQFAETILKEKRSKHRNLHRPVPPVPPEPRPKTGPLSANFNPEEYNNEQSNRNSQIKEPKKDTLYDGFYLKPQDESYIDSNAINHPKNTKLTNSVYEVEEESNKNNSAYEVEEEK